MMNTTIIQPTESKTIAPETFHKLYELYFPLVHRICNRYTKNRDESADLAQEIFLKVHGSFTGFEGQAQPSTWLYRVSVNHCLDYLRWKKRQAEMLTGYGDELCFREPQETPVDNPAKRLLRRLLDEMDAANRQVVFLRFEVGLTHEEISEICGVSRVAITKRLAKFQAKLTELRTELTEELDTVGAELTGVQSTSMPLSEDY